MDMKKIKPYYIVIAEWNYPTGSGHGTPWIRTYSKKGAALKAAKAACDDELLDFTDITGCEATGSEYVQNDDSLGREGYIITPKNRLDDWFYFVHVVEVNPMN